jgi:ATP-binding cassette subfamily F protein uup
MPAISLQSVTKHLGGRTLFQGISFLVDGSERVGLIGKNGCGKSSLLSIIAGAFEPDEGTVVISPDLYLGVLNQESDLAGKPGTVEQYLYKQSPGVETSLLYSTLSICGFQDPQQPVATLSGGWQKRLQFAEMLLSRPSFLLLDEPSNHLDFEGIAWLERFLSRFEGGYLLVTHDRYLLTKLCSRTIEINSNFDAGFLSVNGNYEVFREQREAHLEQLQVEREKLANKARRENAWLRAGVKARTTKSQARIQQAEALNAKLRSVTERTRSEQSVQLSFQTTEHQSAELLHAEAISCSYGDRTLFSDVTLTLRPGMVCGVIGPNGSGKSTLLKLFADYLKPSSGYIRRSPSLSFSYFDQHREHLQSDTTLRDALCPDGDQIIFADRPYHVITWGERFQFRAHQMTTKVGDLSGGERAKLSVARLMARPVRLLLIDEPTNDLDIWSREAFEEALQDFPGATVVVSHDRYFLESICTVFLGLHGDGNATFCSSMDQWDRLLQTTKKTTLKADSPCAVPPAPPKGNKKLLSFREKKELTELEKEIGSLEDRISAATSRLSTKAIAADPAALQKVSLDITEMQARLETCIERWSELAERES